MMTRIQFLLLLLGEEGNEVGKECSKAIRFGLHEKWHLHPLTNADRIRSEVNDMYAVMRLLTQEYGIDFTPDEDAIAAKIEKIKEYYGYSVQCGQVEPFTPTEESK